MEIHALVHYHEFNGHRLKGYMQNFFNHVLPPCITFTSSQNYFPRFKLKGDPCEYKTLSYGINQLLGISLQRVKIILSDLYFCYWPATFIYQPLSGTRSILWYLRKCNANFVVLVVMKLGSQKKKLFRTRKLHVHTLNITRTHIM